MPVNVIVRLFESSTTSRVAYLSAAAVHWFIVSARGHLLSLSFFLHATPRSFVCQRFQPAADDGDDDDDESDGGPLGCDGRRGGYARPSAAHGIPAEADRWPADIGRAPADHGLHTASPETSDPAARENSSCMARTRGSNCWRNNLNSPEYLRKHYLNETDASY